MFTTHNRLSLDLLRTFTVFVSEGTVDQAARKLSLTQAAVSLQLKRFEQEIGRPLFDWSGRKKVLTNFGKDLSVQLSPPLQQLESLLAEVSLSSIKGTRPSLKVTGSSLLSLSFDEKVRGNQQVDFFAQKITAQNLADLLDHYDIVLSFVKPEGRSLVMVKEAFSMRLSPFSAADFIQQKPVLHSGLFEIQAFKTKWQFQETYKAVDWLQALQMTKKLKTWTYLPQKAGIDSGLQQIPKAEIYEVPVFAVSKSLEALQVF